MYDLPAPINLTIWWNFGSLIGLALVTQIVTGLFLSIHYSRTVELAYSSIIHIILDINYGWLIRGIHRNGASIFFLCLYCHLGRGIYYGSYSIALLWSSGVILFLLVIITTFLGYVLPWGQISYWGATVITNMLSAIPYIGNDIVLWVWGGFSISDATLSRFYTFHFILPFIILRIRCLHLLLLHSAGSRNPLGVEGTIAKIPFHIYYSVKDGVGFILFVIILGIISLLFPACFSDPQNFIPANPISTPIHIQPEWYFLFAYTILRSVPNKIGGVLALLGSILIWFCFPFFPNRKFRGLPFYPLRQIIFWWIILRFIILTWIGSCPVANPYFLIGQCFSVVYFLAFPLINFRQLLWDKVLNPPYTVYWD